MDQDKMPRFERLVTLKEASEQLGPQTYKFYRAARAGVFPTYTLHNGRKLVRLSEVVAAINASKVGGAS